MPFEGLGSIAGWLDGAGYRTTRTRMFANEALPELNTLDFLIVMGGPMSVYDENDYPWLAREQALIKEAVLSGMPVLGICLGAQLIAGAMGARVYPNREKEIGWFPVHRVAECPADVFQLPNAIDVFHWHGDTFDLPEGAVRLAGSEACPNQAYQLGRSVLGLQFHLETTPSSAFEMVENCRAGLVPGPYVQSEERLLSASETAYRSIGEIMNDVLAYLTRAESSGARTGRMEDADRVRYGHSAAESR